jgi:hypothetical protein
LVALEGIADTLEKSDLNNPPHGSKGDVNKPAARFKKVISPPEGGVDALIKRMQRYLSLSAAGEVIPFSSRKSF